jgi:regulatory protein
MSVMTATCWRASPLSRSNKADARCRTARPTQARTVSTDSTAGEENRRVCTRKAMDLLARQPHFRLQLETKLRRRGFEQADVLSTCDRLEELGYLDDLECARSLANGRLRRMGYGPRRVRAELARRGAADEVVDAIVSECFASGEIPRLRRIAEGWLRRHPWKRDRLARHLERKGFTVGAILEVLDALEKEGRRADEGNSN